jgi:hypothetical protein
MLLVLLNISLFEFFQKKSVKTNSWRVLSYLGASQIRQLPLLWLIF